MTSTENQVQKNMLPQTIISCGIPGYATVIIIVLIVLLMIVIYLPDEKKELLNKFMGSRLTLSNSNKPEDGGEGFELMEEEDEEEEEEDEVILDEGFNNDLYNMDVEIDSSDYESALKNMVLEPELIAQQEKFSKELMHRVGGTSSRNPVRDDDQNVVPWVGLKRPQYQKINANDETARVVPSELDSDQLADYQMIRWD
jgi:hypothetical protein